MNLKILAYILAIAFSLNFAHAADENLEIQKGSNGISFYAGTFDLIDDEGDDKTSLFGLEHKNSNLFSFFVT